jgi:hypothetical protein
LAWRDRFRPFKRRDRGGDLIVGPSSRSVIDTPFVRQADHVQRCDEHATLLWSQRARHHVPVVFAGRGVLLITVVDGEDGDGDLAVERGLSRRASAPPRRQRRRGRWRSCEPGRKRYVEVGEEVVVLREQLALRYLGAPSRFAISLDG